MAKLNTSAAQSHVILTCAAFALFALIGGLAAPWRVSALAAVGMGAIGSAFMAGLLLGREAPQRRVDAVADQIGAWRQPTAQDIKAIRDAIHWQWWGPNALWRLGWQANGVLQVAAPFAVPLVGAIVFFVLALGLTAP